MRSARLIYSTINSGFVCAAFQRVKYSMSRRRPARVSVARPELTAADAGTENIVTINSPMVGTFYAKPNPEAEAYVKVGDHVSADTIVCVVEAMKVFNEIPAEVSGQIIAVLVENEESVEFGKPLFKVDTSK